MTVSIALLTVAAIVALTLAILCESWLWVAELWLWLWVAELWLWLWLWGLIVGLWLWFSWCQASLDSFVHDPFPSSPVQISSACKSPSLFFLLSSFLRLAAHCSLLTQLPKIPDLGCNAWRSIYLLQRSWWVLVSSVSFFFVPTSAVWLMLLYLGL